MISEGHWFGDGRRSSANAFNALLGLLVFGYPGFMYAVFGRLSWKPEPEYDDHSDGFIDAEEMETEQAEPIRHVGVDEKSYKDARARAARRDRSGGDRHVGPV
jgi:hypothetical protein